MCVCLQVWKSVLWQLQKLLSPEEAGNALDSNIECFHAASAIIKILLTSKVTARTYIYVIMVLLLPIMLTL